jgi:putative ABC transport system permease protein
VVSLSVARRTKEIGTRVALGVPKQQVLLLVFRQGMRLALAGVGIGLFAAFALRRLMSSVLYDFKPTDPLMFVSGSRLFVLVALLACWVPARWAAGSDPIVALRCE